MNAQAKYCSFTMFVLSLATPLALGQPIPIDPTGVSPGSAMLFAPWGHTESNYIIYTDGTEYFSQDGETGRILVRDADAWTVFDTTLTELALEGGGRIYVKPGHYLLNQRLDLISNLLIEGAEGAIIDQDASAAAFLCNGLENLMISHLTFRNCPEQGIRLQGGCSDIRIRACRFEDIEQHAIVNFTENLERIWIDDCYVTRAGMASDPSGTPTYTAINLYHAKDAFLRNNVAQYCGSTGIGVWSAGGRVLVSGNNSSHNDQNNVLGQGHGLIVGGTTEEVVISGNILTSNGGNGIEAGSGECGDECPNLARYVITGNISANNGRTGLWATGDQVIVSNNMCVLNGSTGIHVGYADKSRHILIQNNICGNNNQSGQTQAFRASGIALNNPVSGGSVDEKVLITHNLCYDDQQGDGGSPSPTQLYGIHCQNEVDGVVIESNRVYGNKDGQISYTPAGGLIVRQNVGFATEGSGEASVEGDNSNADPDFVVVDHGLDIDPTDTRSLFHLVPMSNLGGRSFWIGDVNDTSFTIFVEDTGNDAGVSFTFGWSYVAQ